LIQSISILTTKGKEALNSGIHQLNKVVIDVKESIVNEFNSFDIEIVFSQPIVAFRNHDYTWISCDCDCIANEYSPKIIKLSDGSFVQANLTLGIWEIKKNTSTILLWRFNPEYSKPITVYTGHTCEKRIVQANSPLQLEALPALLFTHSPIEFSRSKIPFSAIACFTDHCDFDTSDNLKLQRSFFKDNGVKITKGFFLNHFSKREDNASFENQSEELLQWQKEGHELCYHSLSQSIKSDQVSFEDFERFLPVENVTVWIDHGFQSYNFSLYKQFNKDEVYYETLLSQKSITVLWNYVDCGTSITGVLNQFNTAKLTLSSFKTAIAPFSLKTRAVMLFKNILFHYDNNPKRVRNYIDLLTYSKAFLKHKSINHFISILKNGLPLLQPICMVFLNWKSQKNVPFKMAKYTPLLFKHRLFEKDFFIFQTIEMVDFKKALCQSNIDELIRESGVFIAHTYFSVDMNHYSGKLFKNGATLDEVVVDNFNYLAQKINDSSIWNPTLIELVNYLSNFESILLDIDVNGTIFIKNKTIIIFRPVLT